MTQQSLRVNGLDVDGMAMPAPIGTLVVNAAGANQLQIKAVGLHRVGAAGQLDAIQDQVIVPEPGANGLLVFGLGGLALLTRLHRRRLAARAGDPPGRAEAA